MKEKIKYIFKNKIFLSILFILLSCFIFNLSMTMIEQKTFADTLYYITNRFGNFLKSYILLLLFYIMLLITGKFFISSICIGSFSLIFALINFYKIQYRAEPILPWDIYSIGEAFEVVGSLDFTFPFINILAIFLTLIIIYFSFKVESLNFGEGKRKIINIAFMTFFCFFSISTYYQKIYKEANEWPDTWFRIDYYKNNGLVNSFIYNLRYLSIDKPLYYTKENMYKIAEEIKKLDSIKNNNFNPDIIFIMSESFWDPQTLNGIDYEKELLPNIKFLQENGIRGEILSPKFGGGTSNVEFEALTGFSNDYLPDGCIPYQQYIREGFFSIVDYLKFKGYKTLAIHSDEGKNWNREKAYKNMGFDDFISLEDMKNPEITRGRVSDREITRYIIANYEKHISESDKPWFNFIVTMQNHTGYKRENFSENELVNFTSENILSEKIEGQLADFSTGVKISDEELGKLADYFLKQKRPVLLLFFGDHRVNFGDENREIYYSTNTINDNMTEEEKQYKIHTTPFMAISNFKEVKKDLNIIAPYMILPYVFDLYNIDMPLYFEFLSNIGKNTTGEHLNMTLNEKGIPFDIVPKNIKEIYEIFNMIEYDYIIGENYIGDIIFQE